VPVIVVGEERVHVGGGGVIAENLDGRVDEGAFAVRAAAVGKGEGLLRRSSSEAVSHIALQELLQLGVACRDPIEEGSPPRVRRAFRCGIARGSLGDVISRARRSADASSQIDRDGSTGHQPRISVPLFDTSGEATVGPRETLDRCNGLC